MAESHERIEAKEITGGESAGGCGNRSLQWWKSDRAIEIAEASEFLAETSLHGLKYVGQPKRHIVERVFWVVAFIVGLAAAGFLIYEVFDRYEDTPVIVSFHSKEQSVDTIPFPAATFCFNNQFSKETVESLSRRKDDFMEGDREYDLISEQLNKIESILFSRKSFFKAYFQGIVKWGAPRSDYFYIKNQTQFQQEIIDLLLELTPSCEDMIPFIMLDGSPIERKFQIFYPVITEYGKCCTFNMLPTPLLLKQQSVTNGNEGNIFSNPVLGTNSKNWWNQAATEDWQKWSYEKGFTLSPDSYKSRITWDHVKLSRPFRNQRLGHNFGLSVVINTFEPFDDIVFSRGTTFMLHNPLDTPRVTQFPSVIGSRQEAFIKIHPDITLADPDIETLNTEKRQCLFGKEVKLKYFSPYTQENCFEECTADLIASNCGCSRFYMPRTNETVLCLLHGDHTEGNCVKDTLSLLSNKKICGHCLPLCEYVDYNFEMTTIKTLNWNDSYFFHIVTEPSNEDSIQQIKDASEIYRNISIVHIFYGSPSTVPKLRKRLYGTTDLIANTGGILGLCLGFSVLSGVEVLYYVLMRTLWQMLSRRYQWFNTKVASGSSTAGGWELKNQAKLKDSGTDKKSKFKWTNVFSKCGRIKKCLSFKFKWRYCILIGSVATGFLVFMLLLRNEETVKIRDLFKIPLESDENTELYYAEVTFCYGNQFSMEKVLEFRSIAESTTDETRRLSAETNLSIIDSMCEYKEALGTSSSNKFPPISPNVANYEFLMAFLEENTVSCSQIFPTCVFMGTVQENCNKIIKSVDTIYGKCCMLRMAHTQPKFTNSSINTTDQFNANLGLISGDDQNYKIHNSSLLNGVALNSSYFSVQVAEIFEEFSLHKKISHFSVILNLSNDFYQCQNSWTSTNQILFALNSPGKFLQIEDFSPLLVANEEVLITVFPEAVVPEEVVENEDTICQPYYWKNSNREKLQTTKAGNFDGCSRRFLTSNCKCALFGYEPVHWKPLEDSTCKTEINSNDSVCLTKMNELVGKLKHICRIFSTYCSGTEFSYNTRNQLMRNATKLWASLIKFGNDTSSAWFWENNKTGIIHFAFNASRITQKSAHNDNPLQNSIANGGGSFTIILIMLMSWRNLCCKLQ